MARLKEQKFCQFRKYAASFFFVIQVMTTFIEVAACFRYMLTPIPGGRDNIMATEYPSIMVIHEKHQQISYIQQRFITAPLGAKLPALMDQI